MPHVTSGKIVDGYWLVLAHLNTYQIGAYVVIVLARKGQMEVHEYI